MQIFITHANLFTPHQTLAQATLELDDSVIKAIYAQDPPSIPPSARVLDASGLLVAPGMIDIHFHGALGKDTMDADPQALHLLARWCLEHGVTSFYPTTWAAAPEDILAALHAVRQARQDQRDSWTQKADEANSEPAPYPTGANAQFISHPGGTPSTAYSGIVALQAGAHILGAHVEGPYIDLHYRGAQLAEMIRPPDPAEYQRWFETGVVSRVTCAPEVDHGMDFIQEAVAQGIKISIGHSQATCEQVIQAANLGANQATHIFNGMLGLHHREPGTVGGVLSDERIFVEMICDGVHLHPAVVNLVINAKTPQRTMLVTDAVRGAGLPDGEYEHKGQRFTVCAGVARTPEGGLSGSTLTLDLALRNALRFTNRPLTDILPTVTSAPAAAMGLSGKKGTLQPGADADLVFFTPEMMVHSVWLLGEPVYTRSE